MRQPIKLSHLFPIFCSFGRQNLFHEKANPFQDFVIPALDQETYGGFLHFGPGLGVFTLERFSCTEDNSWRASPFQDFVIPALDQETYGEFLQWGPGLGVFTLERFSCTEEDSRVSVQSTKKESEGRKCLEQKISPVPTKETGAIPKIKVAAANPKLERGPKKENDATPKPKLPRSLACILDINQDEKEYVNPYFMKGRPDLLNEIVRKPLKPFVKSNVRVKKEVLSDEDSVTQESLECASRNQESSRNKSNNVSIQEKAEASRCSTRKRKQNKFYMQEDSMEDEKPSTLRRRDWYKKKRIPYNRQY